MGNGEVYGKFVFKVYVVDFVVQFCIFVCLSKKTNRLCFPLHSRYQKYMPAQPFAFISKHCFNIKYCGLYQHKTQAHFARVMAIPKSKDIREFTQAQNGHTHRVGILRMRNNLACYHLLTLAHP